VAALAVAFALSGGAGLIHEVVWVRLLGLLFGVSELAVATVLAAFMGGLALGSYWVGLRSARLVDRRRTYALLEIGIGVSALLVPLALDVVEPLYGWLWRRLHLSFAVFSVLRFLLAGAILLAPTIMMGATFPVLADHLARLEGRRMRPERLYAANLAGAVLGAGAAGFLLLPTVGVWGTIAVGAALNLVVGAVVLALPAHPERRPGTAPPAPVRAAAPAYHRLLLAAAFFSGLLSLSAQVAWTRVLALLVGSTTYAFAAILVVYLVALAAGSAWAARRASRAGDVAVDLAAMHALTAILMLAAIAAVNHLPYWYVGLSTRAPRGFPGSIAGSIVTAGAVLVLPVFAAGTILPLVLAALVPAGAPAAGPAVGRVYAVNTVGAIAGAVLAGFVLVPRLGTETTLVGGALGAAAMGFAFAFAGRGPPWLPAAGVAALVVVLVGALGRPEWNFRDLHVGVAEPGRAAAAVLANRAFRVVYQREGATASVAVYYSDEVDPRLRFHTLVINARTNASDGWADMPTQVLLAQIPLLLAPRADEVFIVGWGSGVTVGSATRSAARRITAVELEPAVVEASRLFAHVNHDPLGDPRVRLYEDDARHILLASDETYDVIISEPPHPWVAGVANLFTRDFYLLAARRLAPDGVFTQWLQSYQISAGAYRIVLATFQSVFPEVLVFHPEGTEDSILVGSRRPLPLDLERLRRRWGDEEVRAELARVGLERPEDLVARSIAGSAAVRDLVRGARLNTDDNLLVEFQGARDMARAADASEEIFAALARAEHARDPNQATAR
jgi:spermidine synthase